MKAFDKPNVDWCLRLIYDNLFARRPWHMNDKNNYHQNGDCYSYQWDNGFTDNNRIKSEI